MICYQDKTFCTHHETCSNAHECGRALTGEVKAAAVRWWGDMNPPICTFIKRPDCYNESESAD